MNDMSTRKNYIFIGRQIMIFKFVHGHAFWIDTSIYTHDHFPDLYLKTLFFSKY